MNGTTSRGDAAAMMPLGGGSENHAGVRATPGALTRGLQPFLWIVFALALACDGKACDIPGAPDAAELSARGESCSSPWDCVVGLTCTSGTCQSPGQDPYPCYSTEDCPWGEPYCVDNWCQSQPEYYCYDDLDCSWDEPYCVNERCREFPLGEDAGPPADAGPADAITSDGQNQFACDLVDQDCPASDAGLVGCYTPGQSTECRPVGSGAGLGDACVELHDCLPGMQCSGVCIAFCDPTAPACPGATNCNELGGFPSPTGVCL